jgi:hypothetical protein
MLYLSVLLPAVRMPLTSGPRPAATEPPEPARRRADRARSTAADPRAAFPAGLPGRPSACRGRTAARLGNRRLHDTRSEEGGTYRRKGRAGGRAARTSGCRPREARAALAPAHRRRRAWPPAK